MTISPDETPGVGAADRGTAPARVRDHLTEVRAVTDLTDWYRRVSLDPRGLFDQFTPSPGGYLLLNLAQEGRDDRIVQRSYSIAAATPDSFDLEFVLHTPPGPGSLWGAAARPGMVLSVSQPAYAIDLPSCSRALLIADPTALPALRTLTAALSPATAVRILLVDDHPDREAIPLPPGADASWVDALDEGALRQVTADLDPDDCFLWAGGERQLAKTIRDHVRGGFPVPRTAQHVQTYWIRGR